MTNNHQPIDFENGRSVNALVKHLGSMAECQRLGFIFEDERGVLFPSSAGIAFLVFIVARDITDPAEAFAAGYQAASDETI